MYWHVNVRELTQDGLVLAVMWRETEMNSIDTGDWHQS